MFLLVPAYPVVPDKQPLNGWLLLLLQLLIDIAGVDDRSLSNELSALLRVMWSGKWAVVSPHQMLSAVWTKMPFFKGYTQHDAQEFLR